MTVTEKHTKTIGRITAVLVGGIGICIVITALWQLWHLFYSGNSFSVFLVSFMILLAFIGCFCIHTSIKAWSNISLRIVRYISLISVCFLCSMLLTVFARCEIYNYGLQKLTWAMLMMPLVTIIGAILYGLCNKVLLKWFGIHKTLTFSQRKKQVKHFFSWLAVSLWVAFSVLILDLSSDGQQLNYSCPKERWFGVVISISFIFIFIFYKLGVYIVLRKMRKD